MANNGVSQHFKIDKGLDLASDSQFATLGANTKIVYKPSGEKYVKNPNYSNVFDKTDTFGDLESSLKAQAVRRIENSGNPDGTTNYYSIDGTKLGSFISGVSPNDLSAGLGNVRSTSISAIDDANASGVCSCKNSSGTQIDTFTCHVPVSNNNSSLNWGQQVTIGYVDGKVLTVRMPGNPNTDTRYSAGTGLGLNGTTFYIDENWLKSFVENNSGGGGGGGGGSYTIGERYGGTWYVDGSREDGLISSSKVWSRFSTTGVGCSHGPTSTLEGDNPPSGTYYCKIVGVGVGGGNLKSCYIYNITYN